MAKKTYTIYLAKADVADFDGVLSENGIAKLADQNTKVFTPIDFGDAAKLYFFSGFPTVPGWLKEVNGTFDLHVDIKNSSVCALLAFEKVGRIFVTTFAHGHMYLNDRALERDFGLRASINALDDSRLKKLDRTNLSDALRASSLSPFQRDFSSFGMDNALDLVRAVSGNTKDGVTADALSGSYSLKATGEFSIADLPEVAEEALEFFQSSDYQDTAFEVLDLLRPVVDRDMLDQLDGEAVRLIREEQQGFELGLPIHSASDALAYRFVGPGQRKRYSDLLLQHYVAVLGNELPQLTAEVLKKHRISASYDDNRPDISWPIHSALVGSIAFEGGLYAINEGDWFQVDEAFKLAIQGEYEDLVEDWDAPPPPLKKIVSLDGKKRTYEREEEYNIVLSDHFGLILLDQRLIASPGIQNSEFEVCDLLDLQNKKFIHVKKSSRRSSILSHFFKQASHSAQNMKIFPQCWDFLGQIILNYYGQADFDRFEQVMQSDDKWKAEFWIADSPRANGNFNIPFFSKVSLRDEVRRMRGMDYEVGIRFINLPPEVL